MDNKFRKKPVVIEAVQFNGELTSIEALHIPEVSQQFGSKTVQIPTLEGVMTAQPGDWIIKGVKGEFYPCKPDIFEATYERASNSASPSQDAKRIDFIENSTVDLRCHDAPTGGDDYDVHWTVIEHYEAEPHEREIGWGKTPRAAIDDAIARATSPAAGAADAEGA